MNFITWFIYGGIVGFSVTWFIFRIKQEKLEMEIKRIIGENQRVLDPLKVRLSMDDELTFAQLDASRAKYFQEQLTSNKIQ